MKERDIRFDNVKAIMIFFVIFCHAIEAVCKNYLDYNVIKYLYFWIFSFHMPVFIFASGFFTHDNEKNDYNAIARLLIPYLVINTAIQLIKPSPINPSNPMWTLWYLLSLFCWKVLIKYAKHVRLSLLIFIVVALLAGHIDKVSQAFSLSKTICFFPYFLAGYYAKENNLMHRLRIKKNIILPIFIITSCIIVFLVYKNCQISVFTASGSYNSMGYSFSIGALLRFLTYVFGFVGIVTFLSLTPDTNCRLSTIGMFTYPIYIFHSIVLRFFRESSISMNPYAAIVVALLLTISICLIFGNSIANRILDRAINAIAHIFLTNRMIKPIRK